MATIQSRIVEAVANGAQTVKEICAVLDDDRLTEHLISGHCSNLHTRGQLKHVGRVRYPTASRDSWQYAVQRGD